MGTEPPASLASVVVRRGGRWLLGALLVVVGLEVLYLLAAHLFLWTSLADRALNRKPEKLLVGYDSAWSPWPGELRVEGLTIRSQSRRVQWIVTSERATGRIALLPLLGKRFHASDIEGRKVVFRLRRRLDRPPPEERSSEEAERTEAIEEPARGGARDAAPPIPGLENPPEPPPEEIYPPLDPDRRRWTVSVTGLDLEAVQEIWLDRYRLRGEMAVTGGFVLRLKRTTHVLPSRLALGDASLSLGDEAIAEGIEGELRLSSEELAHPEHRGWDSLPFLQAEADLQAAIAGLGFLDAYLGPRAGVRFSEGAGALRLEARLDDGRLAPESRVVLTSSAVGVGFLDYTARGGGEVALRVGEESARLAAELDAYAITREGYGSPHVRGQGLELAVTGLGVELPPSLDRAEVRVEIPPASVPALAFYDAYLPPAAGLEIEAGSGTIAGSFEARPAAGTGSGRLHLSTEGLRARLRGEPLSGRLELEARFPAMDLDARRFRLDGTRVTVRDARALGDGESEAWAGRVTLGEALLAPGEPVMLRAEAAGTVTDVRPLLALASPGGGLPDWVLDVLGIDDVQARAEITAGERVRLTSLVAQADDLRLVGDLDLGTGGRRGRLLLTYGGFALGLDLRAGSTDLKLLDAREWFAEGR